MENLKPKVDEIFLAALERKSVEDRRAYLEAACAGDPELRRRVERLLEAQAKNGSFLEAPAPEIQPTIDQPATEQPGTVIGPYKLIEPIGEGGMGTVWMAQQTEPVKRVVALKLIKAGMDSKQVIARFEAERQALALMDHPNIARVLDAGTTSAGRPYFVMDLVKGVPITKYCDEHLLTPRQRLDLFVPVCQAVQHAHQKGIIHRDLKPSNVLVALGDPGASGVPKVIDFGVAKAAGQSLTDKTLVTGVGNIVGTLEYMSPEQAEINQLDIDTRSDIYSLGVLLYELLAGSPPFTRKELEKAGMLEMLRVIREQEPSKPSTKLSTAEGLPTLAANRGTEPAKLTKLVRGELDWIVMKALEKDRNRRYETANGFAMDLQRYLADEPVLACPPSVGYRLRKMLRRNRGPVLAATLVLLALVGGIAGTTWGLVREAERAEGEKTAKQEALAAAEAEKKANAQAQKRLVQLEKGNEIITSIFTDLDINRLKEGTEPLEAILAKRMVRAAEQLEDEAVGDPLVVAGLQNRLGQTLISLGHPQEAIPLLIKARATRAASLGADHYDTLWSMANLALGYQDAGKLDLALSLYEDTLKLVRAKLGADHPDTLASMNNLANGYHHAGKLDLALLLYEETLKLRTTTLGAEHPSTLTSMANLAAGYQDAGKLDQARLLLEENLKLRTTTLGADHPSTLTSMNNLANCYRAAGQLDQALPLLEETLKLRKATLGADHPNTLTSMNNLAFGYQAAGKLDQALLLFEETLKRLKAKLGADHPNTLASMNNLALGYRDAGKLDQALPLFEETLKLRKAKLGADHPDTLTSMSGLGSNILRQKKWTDAESVLRECLDLRQKNAPDMWTTFNTQSMLGEALLGQKKYTEAEPLLLQGYNGIEQREAKIPPQIRDLWLREALERLVQLYDAWGKEDQADEWRKKLDVRKAKTSEVKNPESEENPTDP